MKTYADFGIEIPTGVGGEIQTTCPECSTSRKKKKARCLSVNTEKGGLVLSSLRMDREPQ